MTVSALTKVLRNPLFSPLRAIPSPGVGGGGWTPQPGDYLLNETGLFLTDESGNQLTV